MIFLEISCLSLLICYLVHACTISCDCFTLARSVCTHQINSLRYDVHNINTHDPRKVKTQLRKGWPKFNSHPWCSYAASCYSFFFFFPKKTCEGTTWGHSILSLSSSREGGSPEKWTYLSPIPVRYYPSFFFFLNDSSTHKILTGSRICIYFFNSLHVPHCFQNRSLNYCSHWIHKFRCPEFWWKNGWLESKVDRDLTFLAF